MKNMIYLALIFLLPQLAPARVVNNMDGTWSINSPLYKVTVNVSKEKVPAGAILELTTPETTLTAENKDFFAIRAGDLIPSEGKIEILDTNKVRVTSSVFANSGGTKMNLASTIDYTMFGNHLIVKYRFETADTTAFPNGLDLSSLFVMYDSLKTYNHTGLVFSYSDKNVLNKSMLTAFPVLEFKNPFSTLWIICRDPYWSLWNVSHKQDTKTWTLKNEILRKVESWSGPASYSVLGPHNVLECEFELVLGNTSDDILTAENSPLAYFSPFPNANEQIVTMMFDNIPFESPKEVGSPPTWYVPKSGHDSTTPYSQYMVRLLEDHPRMKQGWLILLNYIRDSSWIENPEETRWWRVNGKWRNVLYNSTEEYRTWLSNIEKGNLVYGYEDQARLGSHGLHHTPSDSEPDCPTPDSLGPGWEFEHNDPVGAESTFVRIEKMYDSLGLSSKSLRFFRPPGFKTCASLNFALVKHGFKVSDYCFQRAKSGVNAFVIPMYSQTKRLWLIGSTWSGDAPDSYDSVKILLKQGKYLLTAGHPWAWFDYANDTSYEKISKIFTTMETDFPHLDYLFPDEFGDFMDEVRDIHDISSSFSTHIGLIFSFDGKLSKDETLIVEFDPEADTLSGSLWMDGTALTDYEIRGTRIFIKLPHSDKTEHTVTIPLLMKGAIPSTSGVECVPNLTSGATDVLFSADPGQTVSLTVYNTAGQAVRQVPITVSNSNRVAYAFDAKDNLNRLLPGGVYFVEVKGNSFRYKTKLVILR